MFYLLLGYCYLQWPFMLEALLMCGDIVSFGGELILNWIPGK